MNTIKRVLLLAAISVCTYGQGLVPQMKTLTVTIANGASLSSAVSLQACTPIRIGIPSGGFTGTTLTFQVSLDNGSTYGDFRDSYNSEISSTFTTAGDVIQLDPAVFVALNYMKIRAGTSQSPSAQAAARTITIVCKTF